MPRVHRDPIKVGGLLVLSAQNGTNIDGSGSPAVTRVQSLYGTGAGSSYPSTISEIQVGPTYDADALSNTFVNQTYLNGEYGTNTVGTSMKAIECDDAATMVGLHVSGQAIISPASLDNELANNSESDYWDRTLQDQFACSFVQITFFVRRAGNRERS